MLRPQLERALPKFENSNPWPQAPRFAQSSLGGSPATTMNKYAAWKSCKGECGPATLRQCSAEIALMSQPDIPNCQKPKATSSKADTHLNELAVRPLLYDLRLDTSRDKGIKPILGDACGCLCTKPSLYVHVGTGDRPSCANLNKSKP